MTGEERYCANCFYCDHINESIAVCNFDKFKQVSGEKACENWEEKVWNVRGRSMSVTRYCVDCMYYFDAGSGKHACAKGCHKYVDDEESCPEWDGI